jgi:uncharacterized membrane protein YphA (DoxX/SURF4 family)/peroxiredoxin
MDSLVLGLQVLLAGVFAAAGIGKLLDRSGSRQALTEFGVPARAVPVASVLLPLAELATAVALVLHPAARWGALAALALLLAFVAGIANALARGEAPDCHCFGQLHSAPAGRGALARNSALALLAAIVVWQGPGPAVDDWLSARDAAELLVLGAALAGLGLGAVMLRRRMPARQRAFGLDVHQSTPPLPSLPVGVPAPAFALRGADGGTRTLDSLRSRGRPLALVFTGPGCGWCEALYPHLARWQVTLADRLTITVVSSGSRSENEVATRAYGVNEMLLQDRAEMIEAYRVRSIPSAVVVAADGTIASGPVEGPGMVEALIRLAARGAVGASVATAAQWQT